jgi:hypothetical protein
MILEVGSKRLKHSFGGIRYESPKGSFRIRFVEGKDEPFIVSAKNPAERVQRGRKGVADQQQ